MIKTSGYRRESTEIEEIAFRSGLVRDAVALGDDDPALGQRIVLIVTPNTPGQRVADGLQRYFRRNAPNYMVPSSSTSGARSREALTASTNAPGCVRNARRDASDGGALRGARRVPLRGRDPLDRLTARVGSTPYFAYDRTLIRDRVAELRAALGVRVSIGYAVKANPMPALVQLMAGLVDCLTWPRPGSYGRRWTQATRDAVSFAGRGRRTPS
jgi:hypothetical protein